MSGKRASLNKVPFFLGSCRIFAGAMAASLQGKHTIVVGGTGMLSGIALWLAQQGSTVTVIARDSKKLFALANKAQPLSGTIYPLAVDYTDDLLLQEELLLAIRMHGPPALAICYIHDTAPGAPSAIAGLLDKEVQKCNYYHVLSSSSAKPEKEDNPFRTTVGRLKHIKYVEVILGFKVEDGESRWLTDDEITEGMTKAIDSKDALYIIGQVEPWEMRP